MFISNDEKKYLFDQIKIVSALTKDMGLLASEVTYLTAKIKILESRPAPAPKRQKTAAQKAKQREYMRTYKAKKLAEKKALEQK